MLKFMVIQHLATLGESKRRWSTAKAKFDSDADALMLRLLNEAAANKMGVSEVAAALGSTNTHVRSLMRRHGLNPKMGRNLLSRQASETLTTNAMVMGIEPNEMDFMSPLAYLPMGRALRREFLETPAGFECGTCGTLDPEAHKFYCADPSRVMSTDPEPTFADIANDKDATK